MLQTYQTLQPHVLPRAPHLQLLPLMNGMCLLLLLWLEDMQLLWLTNDALPMQLRDLQVLQQQRGAQLLRQLIANTLLLQLTGMQLLGQLTCVHLLPQLRSLQLLQQLTGSDLQLQLRSIFLLPHLRDMCLSSRLQPQTTNSAA